MDPFNLVQVICSCVQTVMKQGNVCSLCRCRNCRCLPLTVRLVRLQQHPGLRSADAAAPASVTASSANCRRSRRKSKSAAGATNRPPIAGDLWHKRRMG
jgi:hypothetical protein